MQIIGVWKYYLLNLWAINITVRQWQPLIKEKWMRTRLERSWGWNTLPGKVLPGTQALEWSGHTFPRLFSDSHDDADDTWTKRKKILKSRAPHWKCELFPNVPQPAILRNRSRRRQRQPFAELQDNSLSSIFFNCALFAICPLPDLSTPTPAS